MCTRKYNKNYSYEINKKSPTCTTMTHGWTDARLHTLTLTLDGCDWPASCPQPLYPQAKSLQCPLNRRIHGFQNWSGNPWLLGHPTDDLVSTLTQVLEPNYLHVLLISTYLMKNNKSVQSLWVRKNTLCSLTEGRPYCKCHGVARVLDQVHNVSMMETHDINVIYCQNAITNM